tara:strand:- start:2186 stop:2830 length:645 start_codon:yes stop_codon:yes gene_type:complete
MMDSSFGDDIKNLAKQILKLKKGSSSQEFYDLSLELFEKAILFKNYNSFDEKNSLKKYMDDNNLSFINDRDINTFDNEKQTVTPLIETIKDMIPEMPETSISSTFIEADPEVISFERKESINIKKDDKIEQNVNDLFASEFKIDLNDRLAFVQKLFNNNNKEYVETMSKLIVFNNWESTVNFIENKVKPKYNSWNENKILEKRFLDILKKRFDV